MYEIYFVIQNEYHTTHSSILTLFLSNRSNFLYYTSDIHETVIIGSKQIFSININCMISFLLRNM